MTNPVKKIILALTTGILANLCFAQTASNIKSKFDFIPGEKIIFFDDFTSENIGDFPLQWITNGSGEIVTLDQFEGRWFLINKEGYYIPEIKESFTDNYTIEFDMLIFGDMDSQIANAINFFFLSGDLANPGYGSQPGQAGLKIQNSYESLLWNNWSEAREWQGDEGNVDYPFKSGEKYHISFWVQKQRVRMYINEQKPLDLPRGLQANYTYNIFRIEEASEESKLLISNFRLAVGLPDMRNRLITEGKLISYGILFDVNSDKLRPESTPSIKEIANVLKENPVVRIKISGHTDSDGADELNLELSKRRAESVKNELVKTYGIDAGRLETEGKGETQAIAPNDSGINKSKNRRVEFVKL